MAHHSAGFIQQIQVKDTIAHVYHILLSADEMLADALGELLLEIAGLHHHLLDAGTTVIELTGEEREAFRQVSFVSYYASRTIQGMGFEGGRILEPSSGGIGIRLNRPRPTLSTAV